MSLVASSHTANILAITFSSNFCAFTKALEEKGHKITTFSLHVQFFRQLFYIFLSFCYFHSAFLILLRATLRHCDIPSPNGYRNDMHTIQTLQNSLKTRKFSKKPQINLCNPNIFCNFAPVMLHAGGSLGGIVLLIVPQNGTLHDIKGVY